MRTFMMLAAVSRGSISALAIGLFSSATVLLGGEAVMFKKIDGSENGTKEILERHTAEIKAGKAKLGSHDLWLWGLGNIDYDNDGDQDLVVSYHGPQHGMILKNMMKESGKLTFVDVTQELGIKGSVPSADWNPVAWDFDGDGFLDMAGLFDDMSTTCLLNEGGKHFAKAPFTIHPMNKGYGITDANGDGYVDIVQYKRSVTQMLYDPKAKKFTKKEFPNELPAGISDASRKEWNEFIENKENRYFAPHYFTNVDLNGDGRKDAVLSGHSGYSGPCVGRFLVAGENGSLEDQTEKLGLPLTGTPILLQDLNGDGKVDVLIAAGPQGGEYLNNGKGAFELQAGPLTEVIKRRVQYLQRVWIVDLNNDGKVDLLVSDRRMGGVYAFVNDGRGKFDQVQKASGWDADPMVCFDINDDGLLDFVVGGPKEEITVYLNACANPGHWTKLYPRMEKPNLFAVDALAEAFHAGEMGKGNARPFWTEKAHPDATPVLFGTGAAETFDLRVTFPGTSGKTCEWKNLQAGKRWQLTPDGKCEEMR